MIKELSDSRGDLFVFDTKDVPFEVKRIFWVTGMERGGHAHRKCKQYYICIGKSAVIQIKDGEKFSKKILQNGKGLFVDTMVWTNENVYGALLVLCSEEYDESEYIRDYNQYLKEYK